jgi:DNA mismatch endonuclease, patch repair protein
MPERLSKKERSENMSKVRGRGNATTELRMVKLLRENRITGWRRHLPMFGKPDFVFRRNRIAVFVDGCFWHGCPRCYTAPQSSKEFWRRKVDGNRRRDAVVTRTLRSGGWTVIRIWECGLDTPRRLLDRLRLSLKTPPDD